MFAMSILSLAPVSIFSIAFQRLLHVLVRPAGV
jgi:hypothetical protein